MNEQANDERILSGLLALAFPSPLYYAARPVVERLLVDHTSRAAEDFDYTEGDLHARQPDRPGQRGEKNQGSE